MKSKEQGAGSREYEAGGSIAKASSPTLPAPGPLLHAPCSTLPARYVTFVNPEPRKGVHVFARIAEVLSRRRPDIRLLLVEGAAKRSSLAALGVDLAGLGNLTIWHNTPDARKFHAVSKLLLMPSLMENAGFIAMEAMTNGIPVLASNRGGLPETIGGSPHPNPLPEGEGTGGFLFDIPARYTPETRDVPTAAEVCRGSRRSFAFGTTRRNTTARAAPRSSVPKPGVPTASRRSTATSSAALPPVLRTRRFVQDH